MTAEMPQSSKSILDTVVDSPDIHKLYANGFTIGLGNADTHIVLQMFGRPIAVVALSYTLAKTLHQKLGRLVSEFEARVERQMLTTDQVDNAFHEAASKPAPKKD